MRLVFVVSAALLAAPLSAQDHSDHGPHKDYAQREEAPVIDHCAMGHLPPEKCPPTDSQEAKDEKTSDNAKEPDRGSMDHAQMDHAQMDHSKMDPSQDQPMDHSTMDHAAMGHGQHGAAIDKSAAGAAPETAVPARAFDGPRHAADAIWGASAMAPSRKQLGRENGGMRTSMVMVERLEARIAADSGEDGYLWDAQAFYGGDINRLVLKTEGEGDFGGALEDAEIQALFSRAIGPFFDIQAGVRFDPEPDTRSHAVIGVQGLAPYMFEVDAALFLSDRGDLTARIEGEYDQRITQLLIVQPRIEIELAAQDILERGIGAGITSIEPGVRLRYEFKREFAPYIGIEYEAALGKTGDLARAEGQDTDGLKVLIGLRAWF